MCVLCIASKRQAAELIGWQVPCCFDVERLVSASDCTLHTKLKYIIKVGTLGYPRDSKVLQPAKARYRELFGVSQDPSSRYLLQYVSIGARPCVFRAGPRVKIPWRLTSVSPAKHLPPRWLSDSLGDTRIILTDNVGKSVATLRLEYRVHLLQIQHSLSVVGVSESSATLEVLHRSNALQCLSWPEHQKYVRKQCTCQSSCCGCTCHLQPQYMQGCCSKFHQPLPALLPMPTHHSCPLRLRPKSTRITSIPTTRASPSYLATAPM